VLKTAPSRSRLGLRLACVSAHLGAFSLLVYRTDDVVILSGSEESAFSSYFHPPAKKQLVMSLRDTPKHENRGNSFVINKPFLLFSEQILRSGKKRRPSE